MFDDPVVMTQIATLAREITVTGILVIVLRYVDGLRLYERDKGEDRTSDIIEDWKKLRGLEDSK